MGRDIKDIWISRYQDIRISGYQSGDIRMSKPKTDTENYAKRKEEVLQRIAETEANTKVQVEKMKKVQEEYDRLLLPKQEMQEALDARRELAAWLSSWRRRQ